MSLSDNIWWQEVRKRVYSPHSYVKPAHCRDCQRRYRADRMNKQRRPQSVMGQCHYCLSGGQECWPVRLSYRPGHDPWQEWIYICERCRGFLKGSFRYEKRDSRD